MAQISTHHSFDTDLATEFSVDEAIVIHHLQHWIKINRRLKKNYIDGKWWTYQTLEEISAHFRYYSVDQIRRILKKLHEKGIILKGNYNKNPHLKTLWYAFVDEETFIGKEWENSNNFSEAAKSPDRVAKSPDRNGEIAGCIKDIDSLKDAKENKKSSAKASRSYGDFVKLTDKEYDSLRERFGQPEVDRKINEINDYLLSTGKKPPKNYAATIRNWIRRKNPDFERISEDESRNREYLNGAKRAHPESFKDLEIRATYVINEKLGKEVMLDIDHETFKIALVNLFGREKK